MNRFEQILALVRYRTWMFHVGRDGERCYLQARFRADGELQHGRKWLLSEHMTDSEVVQTAFKAVLTAEEHEAREAFTYRGAAVFGPHLDVEQLAAMLLAGELTPTMRPEAAE